MKFAVAALAGSAAAFMGPAQKVSMAPLKAATLEARVGVQRVGESLT